MMSTGSFTSVQFSSVAQSCPTICDPMDCSTPGPPVEKGSIVWIHCRKGDPSQGLIVDPCLALRFDLSKTIPILTKPKTFWGGPPWWRAAV